MVDRYGLSNLSQDEREELPSNVRALTESIEVIERFIMGVPPSPELGDIRVLMAETLGALIVASISRMVRIERND